MEVQDARRVREAADVLAAAVAEIDLGSMLPAAHRELVALGERIERTGRTVKSMAAAKVAESAVWRGEGDRSAGGLAGPHHRHHPRRGGQGAAVRARPAARPGGRQGGHRR